MNSQINVAVMASGRGTNFKALAENCAEDDFPAVLKHLIVDNPKAGALNIAKEMNIESTVVDCGPIRGAMSSESSRLISDIFQELEIGLICLAGFMRILKGDLLDEYEGRIMNVHPALLPSFKGLNAQKQAIDYGVRFSGCTVHFVDKGIDTGPIIIQRTVPVSQEDNEETLSRKILKEEHKAYVKAVKLFAESRIETKGRRVFIYEKCKGNK
ncbi:MAG: phosphoribosylglycinamide formyltransferase [Candidatus Krumholzibacteriota bacterium]|nr:phosphoribosylglycinamide formyltransferase [Candidatus Krumholzibacteriota bacterium]